MSFNPGSYGGDARKLNDDSILECKICWHIYDPKEGDEYWQIDPGTPFSKLPDHWSCPNCDGLKNDFMVVES
ncbi:MAG TPA: rubredoxin [Bacteroidetes bacterium]|nr:rubredoxin [Bacteroidota bacterium]